jgi:hypothetical protein
MSAKLRAASLQLALCPPQRSRQRLAVRSQCRVTSALMAEQSTLGSGIQIVARNAGGELTNFEPHLGITGSRVGGREGTFVASFALQRSEAARTLFLPWSRFVLSFRGQPLRGGPALEDELDGVLRVGLGTHGVAGKFRLEFASVAAVAEGAARAPGADECREFVLAEAGDGVDLVTFIQRRVGTHAPRAQGAHYDAVARGGCSHTLTTTGARLMSSARLPGRQEYKDRAPLSRAIAPRARRLALGAVSALAGLELPPHPQPESPYRSSTGSAL